MFISVFLPFQLHTVTPNTVANQAQPSARAFPNTSGQWQPHDSPYAAPSHSFDSTGRPGQLAVAGLHNQFQAPGVSVHTGSHLGPHTWQPNPQSTGSAAAGEAAGLLGSQPQSFKTTTTTARAAGANNINTPGALPTRLAALGEERTKEGTASLGVLGEGGAHSAGQGRPRSAVSMLMVGSPAAALLHAPSHLHPHLPHPHEGLAQGRSSTHSNSNSNSNARPRTGVKANFAGAGAGGARGRPPAHPPSQGQAAAPPPPHAYTQAVPSEAHPDGVDNGGASAAR